MTLKKMLPRITLPRWNSKENAILYEKQSSDWRLLFSLCYASKNCTAISKENGFCRKRVIVAFWAAVGKVALKVLQFLVGDKKGRKFLGYVIGIALFIVLLPVIAIYGLFGWMSGGEVAEIVGYDAVYQNLPTEIREQIDENEIQLDTIETVFRENGLAGGDISKAKLIYLSYLTDRYSEENFYQRLADCFLTVSEESDLLTNISSAFGVKFSDADRKQFNEYFGGV